MELKNFVDAAWLNERLDDKNLFVIDVSFDLFDPANKGREHYEKEHIPGAFYFDIDTDITEDKGEHGGRRGTPDKDTLGAKLAAIGINMDSTIVCCDRGVYSSPRAFWQLKYMGYKNVYVLDGGVNGWKNEGYEVTSVIPESRGQGQYNGSENADMRACVNCMKKASNNPKAVIADAREHRRYTGEYEPLYKKGGHVKGAINIHYLTNMRDGSSDDYIGTKEQWEKNFKRVMDAEEIYFYCGSAIEACINYMFLLELGREAKIYIGSMSDYVTYDDVEVEQGENN